MFLAIFFSYLLIGFFCAGFYMHYHPKDGDTGFTVVVIWPLAVALVLGNILAQLLNGPRKGQTP